GTGKRAPGTPRRGAAPPASDGAARAGLSQRSVPACARARASQSRTARDVSHGRRVPRLVARVLGARGGLGPDLRSDQAASRARRRDRVSRTRPGQRGVGMNPESDAGTAAPPARVDETMALTRA